jgi:hypothetical protein
MEELEMMVLFFVLKFSPYAIVFFYCAGEASPLGAVVRVCVGGNAHLY